MAQILVVDAEAPIRALTRRILVMDDHDVVDVGTGSDALAALGTRAFDAVVLDPTLPDMDGFDLIASLTAGTGHVTPVIVVTAPLLPEDEMRAAQLGALACLAKPVGFGSLRSAIARALETDRVTLDEERALRAEAADLYKTTIDLTNEARQST